MQSTWTAIEDALAYIREKFEPTPLVSAPSLTTDNSARAYLKIETVLPTGSFKVRGALFALHSEMGRRGVKEVVAASTGNHGAAVAYAAQKMGVPAVIFLPERPNAVKRARIAELGARIFEVGPDISAALEGMRRHARETGAFMLDDSTSADVLAGTATIGCEIVEQLPDVSEIWVPMGDTALIRGIAAAAKHLRPSVRVIGVQAKNAPAYFLSWKKGAVITTETCTTIADGLATRTPVVENVQAIRELVDDVKLVSEDQLVGAIRHLLRNEEILAEPAGAATTAAWLANPSTQGDVALVVSGATIADEVRRRVAGDSL